MEHPEPLTPAGELLSANVEQPPRDQSESTEASQAGAPGQGSDSRESDQRTEAPPSEEDSQSDPQFAGAVQAPLPLAEGPLAAEASEQTVSPPETANHLPHDADASEHEGSESHVIDVRCFGALRVLGDGKKVSAMRQYKSWEVLAFLACHEEGGVSKDKVLAALWPDLDEDTAMNRLRVYMTRLRNVLTDQLPWLQDAKDVVRCDRDGLCRLDTDLVRSDVHRFRDLCEIVERPPAEAAQSRYDELRDLYRGELLDEPTYGWVHERDEHGVTLRERYANDYVRITTNLAQRWRREGRADLAIPLFRKLLELDPTDEDVVAELYRCHADMGDLEGLMKEERQFRQAIDNLFDEPDAEPVANAQPGPAIAAAFNQVRHQLEAQRPQRDEVQPPRLRSVVGGG